MELPRPYDGDKPYVFISYAHRDSDRVMPIVETLCSHGYRVWYDQGIDPGTEWDETIAAHVEQCGCFVALMSKSYLASSNCKDELNYARDCEKERLIVYLEDVALPKGMAMRINRLQAIFKHKYRDEAVFYEKLFSTPSLDVCKSTKTPVAVDQSATSDTFDTASAPVLNPPMIVQSLLSWAPCVVGTALAVLTVLLLITNPDLFGVPYAAFAVIATGAGMALSTNRMLGALSTLSIAAAMVTIQFYAFFDWELIGTVIATLCCLPFVAFVIRWWIRVLKK